MRNESFALLKTKASFSAAEKLMLNLQKIQNIKKRPVAVLGETRPVYPDKGCVGEVLGSVYLLSCTSQDGSMELMTNNCHETLSHPAVSRCLVDSLIR